MKFDWKSLTVNIKTTVAGVVAFLFSVPAVISGLEAWAKHQPVDWRVIAVSIAMAAGGLGLVASKDSTTHSTLDEVRTSTVKAEIEKVEEAKPIQKA